MLYGGREFLLPENRFAQQQLHQRYIKRTQRSATKIWYGMGLEPIVLCRRLVTAYSAAGTPALTSEMVAIATQYAPLGRLCEVVDGAAGRPTYEYVGDNTVRASHLAKQRTPAPHTYPILFLWPLVQSGLATVRGAFRGEIAEQQMDSLTGIGGRMNRCLKVLHAQYIPGWSAHFNKGLTSHKLRTMACAWLFAKAAPGMKFVGFIQRVLGHTFTSASLYYELLEHKKVEPFMPAQVEPEARSGPDMTLMFEIEAVLQSKKHKAADLAFKSHIHQALQ